MYRIIKSTDSGTSEIKYLVVNKYSGKIEYIAETADEAKTYVLSR